MTSLHQELILRNGEERLQRNAAGQWISFHSFNDTPSKRNESE